MSLAATGRDRHLRWLFAALSRDRLPRSIFLWGPRATGKKYLLNKVLEMVRESVIARVSAEEIICGVRAFLESVLNMLGGPGPVTTKVDNAKMFLRHLKSLYPSIRKPCDRVVVVVYHSERLRQYQDILYAFINAQDYAHQNICFVFCSTLPWECLNTTRFKTTHVRHFPQYNRTQLKAILKGQLPKLTAAGRENTKLLSEFYVDSITSYFNKLRDLRSFTAMVTSRFEEFLNMWMGFSEMERSNSRKLFYKVIGLFDSHSFIGSGSISNSPSRSQGWTTRLANSKGEISLLCEMPLFCKYILIAAYIASRNPVNSDRKFFVRLRGKRKRKATAPIAAVVTPQAVPLSRLLAILSSLNRDICIPLGSGVRYQVSSLCSVGLLCRVGEELGDCKYKCLAGFDLIELISRSVDFAIEKYLCCSA